jgi:DNA methylase/ParB-like nuclease domain
VKQRRTLGSKRNCTNADPDQKAERIAVIYRPITQLKVDPSNPRVHSPAQVEQLARSIRVFGFNVPVLVDRKLRVIAGHGRILACRELGWDEVPTICLEHLSEAQSRAFMIADNRLTEIAAWDERVLAQHFKALSLVDLDFDLETTGFSMAEIDLLIENLSPVDESAHDPADDLPDTVGPRVSQPGDMWLLGPNRVLCGSALEQSALAALMGDHKASVIFTDPPYNVPIEGNVSGLGAVRHRNFAMAAGEMSEAQFTNFLTRALSLLANHSRDGSIHFVCIDWRHLGEMLAAGRKVYSGLKNLCVWTKDNGGMGSLYRSQHELVFVFKHGRDRHRNNVQLGRYGRNRSNVWHYPGANSFSRNGEEGNLLASSPCPKPVAMVADAILDCSIRGDIVLDSFLGGGTTVIAAERTGRRCYGIELDPLYVDVVVRRWQAFSGQVARQQSTGRSFDELAAEVKQDHGV